MISTLLNVNKNLAPPIFIVGTLRSGTTLLLNALGNHPNIYSIKNESSVFVSYRTYTSPYFLSYEREKDSQNLTLAMLTLFFHGDEWGAKFIKEKNYSKEILKVYGEVKELEDFKRVKDRHDAFNLCSWYLTISSGKNRWVEKTPAHLAYIPAIIDRYPDAKFIEIYRDPRAVCHSWLYTKYEFLKNYSILKSIHYWRKSIYIGEKLIAEMPNQFYLVKYEDLIINPEFELSKLCDFISEEFHPELFNVNVVNSTFYDIKNETGFSHIPLKRRQTKLTKNELLLIDLLTIKARKKLGYDDALKDFSAFSIVPFLFFLIRTIVKARKELKDYFKHRFLSRLSCLFGSLNTNDKKQLTIN